MDLSKKKKTRTPTPGEREFAAVLLRRARKKIPHFESDEELSLVPYLDVMMNLVIFMLVTIASFMPLSILSIFPPSVAKAEKAAASKPRLALNLTVAISDDAGYLIADSAGKSPPIPRKADGSWDYDALHARATEIKKLNPTESTVFIVADRQVRYEVLIKTMDALRGKPNAIIFADVKLGYAD